MRRRRPPSRDERAALLVSAAGHLMLLDYRRRLGPLSEGYQAIEQAIQRLLTAEELTLVRQVAAGAVPYDRLGPVAPDGAPAVSIIDEAGVRCTRRGWTVTR